jgi:hypothetical protein
MTTPSPNNNSGTSILSQAVPGIALGERAGNYLTGGLGGKFQSTVAGWLGLTKWVRELEVFFLRIGNGVANTLWFGMLAVVGCALMFGGIMRIFSNASVADFASLAMLI